MPERGFTLLEVPERGFTLLEIMLVIFLIGLASAGVVQTFATASEPPAKKAAQDFLTRLNADSLFWKSWS